MNSDIIPYCIAAYPTILFVYLFVIHPRAVAKTIGHSAKAWDISPKTEDKIDKWLFTITHYGILGTIWAQARDNGLTDIVWYILLVDNRTKNLTSSQARDWKRQIMLELQSYGFDLELITGEQYED